MLKICRNGISWFESSPWTRTQNLHCSCYFCCSVWEWGTSKFNGLKMFKTSVCHFSWPSSHGVSHHCCTKLQSVGDIPGCTIPLYHPSLWLGLTTCIYIYYYYFFKKNYVLWVLCFEHLWTTRKYLPYFILFPYHQRIKVKIDISHSYVSNRLHSNKVL
jgi:hypothetical protein